MKKLSKDERLGLVVDGLFVAGAVLVSVGAALVWLPAGLIAGGGMCIVGAVLVERGRRGAV